MNEPSRVWIALEMARAGTIAAGSACLNRVRRDTAVPARADGIAAFRRIGRGRQPDGDAQPLLGAVAGRDAAAMRQDGALGDGQAQAIAVPVAGIAAVEGVEQGCE